MNIFILDEDPVVAASLQCDKHVVKMILESAQMLSTAHRVLDGTPMKVPSKSGKSVVTHYVLPELEDKLYRTSHINHPCNVWVRESKANYDWLFTHFVALCYEYRYRYGKTHKSSLLKEYLDKQPKNIPNIGLTPFVLGMKSTNPECMNTDDPVGSYQKFYQTKQSAFKMVWTKRKTPEWFVTRASCKYT